MNTSELKTTVLDLLRDTQNKTLLSVIYDMLVVDKEEFNDDLSTAQQNELMNRIENHKSGKSKSYNWEEVKQTVRAGK